MAKSPTVRNFLDALVAVLAGNAIYFLLMPHLPLVTGNHQLAGGRLTRIVVGRTFGACRTIGCQGHHPLGWWTINARYAIR